MIKVSVVITIYNGETYLRQCLDSVCSQTLKDIEIICVDDGSTDSSWDILESYRAKDNRFKLYRQQNLYAGTARNNGKSHAEGKYLVFWDCDDFFDPEALEILFNRSEETDSDICVCGANDYYQDKEKIFPASAYLNMNRIPDAEVFNRVTNENYIMNFTTAVAWNKMFKREFIEQQGLDFQGIRNGNDIYFTMNALCLAERISYVNKPLVTYRTNQNMSLLGTLSKAPLTPFRAWISVGENLERLGILPERSYANKALSSTIHLLHNLSDSHAFFEAMEFLKKEGMEKLHIKEREEDFYYVKWHGEHAKHLLNDTPEEFQAFFQYATYAQLQNANASKRLQSLKMSELKSQAKEQKNQIKDLKREKKALLNEIEALKKKQEKLKRSWAYRIGTAIVWIPRKIKRLFKKK